VLLIGFFALLLILCAVRYAQLRADRLRRATQYQPPLAREAWVANALRANSGLTPEAAAILYERAEEIKDDEGDPFMD